MSNFAVENEKTNIDMSNTIGFQNFRRFQNFPEIELGDITILIGGNNAGKSTLVKAMLLMRDFLKSRIERVDDTNNIFKTFTRPHFSFDTEHVNVGDFYRAFCRQSPQKESTISFTMKIEQFRFVVNISGERKPGVIPQVSLIAVLDVNRDVAFTFDFAKGQMTARFGYDDKALNDNIDNIKIDDRFRTLDELKRRLAKSTDLGEVSDLKLKIELLQKEIESQKQMLDIAFEEYDSVTIDMSFFMGDNVGKLVIPELIKGFAYYPEIGVFGDKRSKEYKEREANKSFLEGKKTAIKTIAEEIERVINSQSIEYIYAHSVYQDSVYAKCANSSDYTKRTIHEFYTSRISQGDDEFTLIEDWLKELKIGTSLKVIPYKGDNYSLVIFDEENPEVGSEKRKGYPGGIDLADKGMGSIQLVILLLRLATLIRKYKGQQLTILLEEPEQNLHPAVQSKLADLVNEVNRNFGVRFIIETHSEYLIRRSQVIVAENNYKDLFELKVFNPFRVFYLPLRDANTTEVNSDSNDEDNIRYEMGYTLSGRFTRKFGEGFFDEAGKSNLITLRKEKELQK